ncbi:MAG TPA: hypothetical protein VK338_04990 [Candidatus Nitrosocosmicus sp.]|nr:hypothetical protein [Candidatus Nitrosocosmicus sp.]
MNKRALFISGILLRILLMPFFSHTDIVMTYRRAEEYVFHGVSIFSYSDPFVHLIEMINLKLFSIVLPHNFFHVIQYNFYELPHLNTLLFIFELPYLLAELLAWWLVFKYILKPTTLNIVLVIFNPIILYSVYIFGRYESIPILFSILILIELEKKKLSIFKTILYTLGLIFSRFSLIMILPAFLFIKTRLLDKILILGTSIISIVIFLVINRKTPPIGIGDEWLKGGYHTTYFFDAGFNLKGFEQISIFFVVITIVFLYTYKTLFIKTHKLTSNGLYFSHVALQILFLYYSFSIFHPQYISWFIPFYLFILKYYQDQKLLITLFILMNVFYLFVPLSWGNATTTDLFYPISRYFGSVDIQNFIDWYKNSQLSTIPKSVLSGIFLFTLMELFNLLKTRNQYEK